MHRSPYLYFVWLLVLGNTFLIGFYFSGIPVLQQIVAPTIEGLPVIQSREFGLLEMLQNGFLLCVVYMFAKALLQQRPVLDKLFFATGCCAFLFLLLEEIDYGLHFKNLLLGEVHYPDTRNIHNRWTEDGVEYATYFKKTNDFVNIVWFALIPILLWLSPYAEQAKKINLIPSRWFLVGFAIALVFARIAHSLEDHGFAELNGHKGALYKAVAEFRETSLYYLYLLYAKQLYDGSPLLAFLAARKPK